MMYIMDMAKDEPRKANNNKVPVPTRLEPDLFKRLMDYCKKGGWVRNSVVEKAIEEFLDRKDKKEK